MSQTFGLDKTESDTLINPVDVPQPVAGQEEHVECSIVQNDYKTPAPGVEPDNADIQFNKVAENLPMQYSTEVQTVRNL